MKQLLAFWFLSMVLPVAAAQTQPSSVAEQSFAPGGKVTMKLSAGRYSVRPGNSSDKILVQWKTIKPGEMSRAKVNVEIHGSEAVITAQGPRDLQVEIGLPEQANIYAKLRKGDIDIRGIEGNKEIECRWGDITIHGSAAEYKQAALSVRLGDIEAPPFEVSKGGVLRSFHWQGKGKYMLNLRVRMGSISVLEK